ncbi:phosphatase PAP2 family protein [Bacillus sp. CLL-7-23]|uniref:Phosphatase PAP2 family protein n=1 Tax=Bacillus changyiensis TaxID=3004103 RepID=A0ABT4X4U3_9BACI|nr:phosphatase PAP2 family protein [Bacillus changyiensis]MDA7027315.1 phosphatase PAP2 family protein [Bacillus changyiensis]
MNKLMNGLYHFDCRVLFILNGRFHQKALNRYFRTSTHLGGALCTILTSLALIAFGSGNLRMAGAAGAIALFISHLHVMLMKKLCPRKRPYMTLKQTHVLPNPLTDHSFPSGHTTAIFSMITPHILFYPSSTFLLIPIGVSVGLSRVYLGLHYPSDVLSGLALGVLTGTLTYMIICF